MLPLHRIFKSQSFMEEKQKKLVKPIHTSCEKARVDVYTNDEVATNRLLRGRALFDFDDKRFLFSQNEPRGPRSKEVGRTLHSRYVRRNDGDYTLTFHCSGGEKNLREMLISEVRDIATVIKADYERRCREEKGGEE